MACDQGMRATRLDPEIFCGKSVAGINANGPQPNGSACHQMQKALILLVATTRIKIN